MDSTTAYHLNCRKRLIILGRVQGVYFRASMCREAERYKVTGWVRNRLDGSLEAMLQGEAEALESLIEWARHGPPGARVDQIEISEGYGDYQEFSQYPTL